MKNKIYFMLADGVVGCSQEGVKKLNHLLASAKRVLGHPPCVRDVLVILKNNDDMRMDCVVIETVPISGE